MAVSFKPKKTVEIQQPDTLQSIAEPQSGPTPEDFAASFIPGNAPKPDATIMGIPVILSESVPMSQIIMAGPDPDSEVGEWKPLGSISNIEYKTKSGDTVSLPTAGGFKAFAKAAQGAHTAVQAMNDKAQDIATQMGLVTDEVQAALVDDYLSLQAKLDAIDAKAILKQQETIKKKLAGLLEGYDPAEPVTLKTLSGEITFSACSEKTEIENPMAVMSALDEKGFDQNQIASVMNVGLGKLKKLLSENEIEPLVTKTVGSRSLTEAKVNPVMVVDSLG